MGALQRFTHEFETSAESIGLETILEAGPGGHYLDKMHTARHFREEHWNPSIWSRQMLRPWMESSRHLDADIAREKALQLQLELERRPPQQGMSEALEGAVLGIIERARRAVIR
jgi:trimethylamine:corrinoid methyltransferase-like protein